PPAGRLPLARWAIYCLLNSRPGIQSPPRPVTPKCRSPAAASDALPSPRPVFALGASISQPHFQSVVIGIGVQRLEAGNHAELAESRDVLRGDGLDMFDSRTRNALSTFLIGIEREPNCALADSMGEQLETSTVELRYRLLVLGRLPK